MQILFNRSTVIHAVGSIVAVVALSAVTHSVAAAQQPTPVRRHLVTPLQISATTIAIDPTSHVATVHVTNTGNDTVRVNVTLQFTAPHATTSASQPMAAGLLAGDSVALDSIRKDSVRTQALAERWSVATWADEVPSQIAIPPHQTWTGKLHFMVPTTLASGDYSSYVVFRLLHASSLSANMQTSQGGQPPKSARMQQTMYGVVPDGFMLPAFVKLTYHR